MRKKLRKKTAKRKAVEKDASRRIWGFDYGLSINAAAIGSIEFNNNLHDAEIIAVAYGIQYSTDLGCEVPAIILVGRNEEPLRKAFEEFANWAKHSDADAVDVTIVFLKSGGYRLMINPESNALIDRITLFDAVINPISIQVSWIKPIDTISEPLRQLREHLEKGIRPYIFSAATYSGIAMPGRPPVHELIRPIRGIQLLKFKIRFADEGSGKEDSFIKLALMNDKKTTFSARNKPHLPSPDSLQAARMNRLYAIFPVILWRAKYNNSIRSICEDAEKCGLHKWQVQQALCNAVISREITQGLPYFEGTKKKDWPGTLVTRLRQRYEYADSRSDIINQITSEELIRQTTLDAGVILMAWGLKKQLNDVDAIQEELLKRKLL